MSKLLKKELLKTMDLVNQAIKVFKNAADTQEKRDGLTDIQTAIITVGTKIEKIYGEACEIMPVFSEAVELVYEISVQKNPAITKKMWDDLKYKNKKAINWIENQMSDKNVVVFMPYKYSMWDSLKSVYEAALKSEDTEVYLMPIPYYHCSENLKEWELVYEGKYFENLEAFVSCDDFSVQDNMPDAIFIHNPYDDRNKVTCVDPRFFSRELKNYTEHLVYIPYKVSNYPVKPHFCATEGVLNAWRVYCQSEANRDVYIRYNSPDKIRVIGSPKIDEAIRVNIDKPELPDEWQKKINNRKVFLINSELDSIMNNGENMIVFMHKLIDIIKERDDIVAIWRPHPLAISTMRSMSPTLLPPYNELVKEFKQIENTIYDETPSPNLVLAYADAYIGGSSSMITLFGANNKPIYHQNNRVKMLDKDVFNFRDKQGQEEYINNKNKWLSGVYTNKLMTIETYIDIIVNGDDFLSEIRKNDFQRIVYDTSGNVGKNIWMDVRKEL